MQKKLSIVLTLVLALFVAALGGCSSSNSNSSSTSKEDKTITVGAVPTPHAEILAQVKDVLAKEGYTLKVVEYNDYVLPNKALSSGDLDANYFQHQPYLDDFNKQNGTHIVGVASIHFEPFGIYAGNTKSLDHLKDGAIVALPNDATNEARALLLLESKGLITLKKDAGITATIQDIKSNPKNLQFKEIEAAQIIRAIKDVDIACVNGNYAIQGGYKISDALAVEKADSLAAKTYANIVAVNAGHEKDAKIQALVKALKSDEVRQFITDKYKGAVVPVF